MTTTLYALFFCHILFSDNPHNPGSFCKLANGPYPTAVACQQAKGMYHSTKTETSVEFYECRRRNPIWESVE